MLAESSGKCHNAAVSCITACLYNLLSPCNDLAGQGLTLLLLMGDKVQQPQQGIAGGALLGLQSTFQLAGVLDQLAVGAAGGAGQA